MCREATGHRARIRHCCPILVLADAATDTHQHNAAMSDALCGGHLLGRPDLINNHNLKSTREATGWH